MPTILDSAQCGPQKKGTTRPKAGTNTETLNPCPLNACCDGWAKYGITKEFCTPSRAGSGAPGAFKPGTNGCFSNFGTDIVNNKEGPDVFARLTYFEGWNVKDRNCSTLDADDIPDHFSHVYFAFVDISPNGVPSTARFQDQFDKFTKRKDWKRIASFGGWLFSTELPIYRIFRNGTVPPNCKRFTTKVVKWVVANGLDGVDFDWEYPGEPDTSVTPPKGPEKGIDYLEILKLVR
jgi:GH18 family chitinase